MEEEIRKVYGREEEPEEIETPTAVCAPVPKPLIAKVIPKESTIPKIQLKKELDEVKEKLRCLEESK